MQDLFEQAAGRVLVLGAGALGCRIAAAGAAENIRAHWGAVHTDSPALLATGLDRKLRIPMAPSAFAERSAGCAVAAQAAEIAALASGRSAILLCGGWDEPLTRALWAPLCRAVKASGVFVCALAAAAAHAEASAPSELERECDLLIELAAPPEWNALPARERHAAREKELLAATEALAAALSRGCDGGEFSPEALRSLLGHGRAGGAVGMASGDGAPARAASAALERLAGATDAVAVLLLCKHAVSAVEEDALAQAVIRQKALPGAAVLLGAAVLETLDPDAICLLLARNAQSNKILHPQQAAGIR